MALSGRTMLALVLVVVGLHGAATATEFTVGGSTGWTLVSNGFFDSQFANLTVVPGDSLLFPYTAPSHNVYEVSAADLAACDFSNPIKTYTQSNPVIALPSAGVYSFGCEVTGHCNPGNMKLTVTVTAGSSPAPAPSTAPTTSPTPAPTTTTPAPTPTTRAPTPSKTPAPAPGPKARAPSPGSPTAPIVGEAPAPSPNGPGEGGNSGTVVTSGPAMIVGAIVAGFAYLLF